MDVKHLKTIKINNPKNTVVQIPRLVIEQWGLDEGDSIDMKVDETTGAVIISPNKGYIKIKALGDESEV